MSYEPPSYGQAETLDSHGGAPRPDPRRRRTTIIATAGAVGVVAVGGAAWAAWSFFATGAQPAEALPDSTIAYASIDLDPSGGQKIAALRTLSKFPAFDDLVGLDADDDVRRWIFDQVREEAGCESLDYDGDVEPWLGDRFAAAAVDTGDDTPVPVLVLQVTDDDAADAGLSAIGDCAGGGGVGAWAIRDGWALLGESQDVVDAIADDAGEASLAADDDFQHWTDVAGDSGILALYAAPEAGAILADELAGPDEIEAGGELVPEEGVEVLEDFRGAAATLRFDDGGVELEVAADAGATGTVAQGDAAGDVVASLPGDTVAALGLSLGDGWFDDLLDRAAEMSGESADELVAQASEELGIDLPADAETLAGDAIALAIDADFDPDSLSLGAEPGAEPSFGVGVKVLGDPDGIDAVLEKVRAALAGADGGVLDSDTGDGAVAIGPDADYRGRLLDDRGLGDTDAFEHVVEHRDDAAAVLFVDADRAGWLTEVFGDDAETSDNIEPLEALGLSAWVEDDTTHAVLKVTTD